MGLIYDGIFGKFVPVYNCTTVVYSLGAKRHKNVQNCYQQCIHKRHNFDILQKNCSERMGRNDQNFRTSFQGTKSKKSTKLFKELELSHFTWDTSMCRWMRYGWILATLGDRKTRSTKSCYSLRDEWDVSRISGLPTLRVQMVQNDTTIL